MNEGRELGEISIVWGGFGARFAPIRGQRQVGETEANPSAPVVTRARRKLLKKRILRAFQFGEEMPCYR